MTQRGGVGQSPVQWVHLLNKEEWKCFIQHILFIVSDIW